MPEILKPGDKVSEEDVILRAVNLLKGGGIIAYPTETFYGLGVDAANELAVEKIFTVKGRDFKNPVALIIHRHYNISSILRDIPPAAEKLMQAFWPGALTILFNASDKLSPLLTAATGKIGLRVSSHPVAEKISAALNQPLTATSANLSGSPECSDASDVMEQIGGNIDAVLDFGKTPGGKPSTLIDVTANPPVILREGAVDRKTIEKHIA